MITELCQNFINKKIDLEDFQRKLNLINIEDEANKYLLEVVHNADNKLEEIRFCSLESNYYCYGLDVVLDLLDKIKIDKH